MDRDPANYAILLTVKKLLIICLLIVLPLQYSWAAAAAYCQHENEQSQHFGHHAHEHTVQADASDGQGMKASHGDCEYCHLFCQASLLPALSDAAKPDGQVHLDIVLARYSSHSPASPKEPDWSLAA